MARSKKEKKVKDEKDVGVDLVAAEAELVAKYPDQKIKKGSLAESGAFPEFGQKRTIVIFCQGSGDERRIATSDLHQVKYSEDYIKQLRLQRRKDARGKDGKKRVRASKGEGKRRGRRRKAVVEPATA